MGKQGSFAKPCRSRDECNCTLHSPLEPLDEMRTRHEVRPRARHMQLGRQQGMEWLTLLGKQERRYCCFPSIRPCCWSERRWELGLALSAEHICNMLQPRQGEISSLAQMLFRKTLARS